MQEHVVICVQGEYTGLRLVKATYQPYVAAWKYHGRDWEQGHYFRTERDMRKFMATASRH